MCRKFTFIEKLVTKFRGVFDKKTLIIQKVTLKSFPLLKITRHTYSHSNGQSPVIRQGQYFFFSIYELCVLPVAGS